MVSVSIGDTMPTPLLEPMLYYTSSSKEAYEHMPPVAVLLSAASFTRQYKNGYGLLTPRLPHYVTQRAADCGGFPATLKWGGVYRFKPHQYIAWLWKWLPQWAAIFDLLCVDEQTCDGPGKKVVYVYPGKEVVEDRQCFTTDKAHEFCENYCLVPWAWAPIMWNMGR